MSDELHLYAVLREEYIRLHGAPPADESGTEAEKLRRLYTAIHGLRGTAEQPGTPRTAFCISGGGIRSATFALGVIQRLAKVGLLPKFDFVSTVSGGGYIGSWLSSYARRNPDGMAGVADELTGGVAASGDPLKPEVEPLTWLRRFSNYLTPRLGLTSGDTWAFIASYLRNTFLIWLTLMPLLIAALAVPRLSIALMRTFQQQHMVFAAVGGAALAFAMLVLAFARPVSYKEPGWLTNAKFITWVFVPLFIGSISIVLYWASRHATNGDAPTGLPGGWKSVGIAMIASSMLSSIVYMLRFWAMARSERIGNVRTDSNKNTYVVKKLLVELITAAGSAGVATLLLYAATKVFHDPLAVVTLPTLDSWKSVPPQLSTAPGALFLCLGVPLVLAVLFIQAAIFVGGASWYNEEYDREWWARAGGWVLVAGAVWVVFTAIVIYGPILIFQVPRLFAAVGGVSGLLAILGGRSGKTSATEEGGDEATSAPAKAMNISLGLVGSIFVVAIAAVLSLATSEVLMKVHGVSAIEPNEVALASRTSRVIEMPDTMTVTTPGVPPKTTVYPAKLRSSAFPAIDAEKYNALRHLWMVDHTSVTDGLILVFGLTLFGVFVSLFVGVNQFSMHALYRNRLIRAYLGASRFSRTPNAFSGFDPNDNLPMHRLRPEMLWSNSFLDIVALAALLKADARLAPSIGSATWDAVDEIGQADANDRQTACLHAGDLLADDLNRLIDGDGIEPEVGIDPTPVSLRNRATLEARFAGHIRPMDLHKRPMHVVNMTLNLTSTENLAWQERKAGSFGASPINTGNWYLGYRPTRSYGGPAGLSLGTAVAISGAFASPNMGYHSSPSLSFLLTLFNVRLGWWLGNPRSDSYQNRNPASSLVPFLAEAIGSTNEDFPYIYLSDGGHFDNLGLYEMVMRRCGCIVVSDAAGDPSFGFGDLGNAIRKIRIDFGIDITIDHMGLFPRSKKNPSNPKYCAVATIHYERVDGPGAKPGRLLYIKPAFYGEGEPKDIYNYAVTNATFPHQTTADQWFSESQFESYRQLGYFILEEVGGGEDNFASVGDLIEEADKYVRKESAKGLIADEDLVIARSAG